MRAMRQRDPPLGLRGTVVRTMRSWTIVDNNSSQGSPSWRARKSSVLGMPGGYDGYLVSLHRVADYVASVRPTPGQLQSWMRETLSITAGSAYTRWRTLCRAGWLLTLDGVCIPAPACVAWLRDDDPAPLIAEMHRNVQFIGELLALSETPLSTEELLLAANTRYRMGWRSVAQLNFRRGWLQSAGLLEHNEVTGALKRTDGGSILLIRLEIEPPMT